MRLLILILFITIFAAPRANAESPEPWVVKTVACASGKLQTGRTLKVGEFVSPDGIRMISATGKGAIVETGHEAVLTVKVSGDNDGACHNDQNETVLIVVFSK